LAAWLAFDSALQIVTNKLLSGCCLPGWLQVLMEDFLEGLVGKVGAQP
jgi:hypothetical protein